ncbi:MAG: hypothetical protein WCG55_02415 [bacterium]
MADDLMKKIPVVSSSTSGAMTDAKTAPSDGETDPFDDVKKEIASRYELLPEEIKKVIMDDAYPMKLFTIAKDLKLTYDELGIIELETMMVLLGMTKPADFRDEVQIQLKKNDGEIDVIVREINTQIFNPIRSSIESLYTNKKEALDYIKDSVSVPEQTPVTPSQAVPPQPAPTPVVVSAPIRVTPPSAAPIQQGLTATEKTVLESTGVVIHDTPTVVKQTPPAPIAQTPYIPPAKAPEAAVPKIVSAVAPTMSASKVTDYSIIKPIAPNSSATMPVTKPSADPYREPLN